MAWLPPALARLHWASIAGLGRAAAARLGIGWLPLLRPWLEPGGAWGALASAGPAAGLLRRQPPPASYWRAWHLGGLHRPALASLARRQVPLHRGFRSPAKACIPGIPKESRTPKINIVAVFSNLLHSSGTFSINAFLSLAGTRHPSLPVEGDFVNYVLRTGASHAQTIAAANPATGFRIPPRR